MGSRNTSVRTGRQKVSQVTDNTRPPGLTTLVPTRVFRDFATKTKGSFRATPSAAAVIRTKNHNGINQINNIDWHKAFGLEEYGHGNYGSPQYDTGSGELSSVAYGNMGTVGGSFASADARLINDVSVAHNTHTQVLDVKMSRDGRYTYVLSASMLTVTAEVYFNVIDNLTGVQLFPNLNGSPNADGHINPSHTANGEPMTSAWGNIAVVDDTTSQDASHHMAYNSCVFAVQFVTDGGGGTRHGSHAVFRFDYAANNVDELYTPGPVNDFTTSNAGTNAWCEIQLVTQVGGVLQAMLAYRSTVTGASPDAGVPAIAMWTTWAASDNPTSGPNTIATASTFDFGQPLTTAVSQRGAPTAARRFYLYHVGTGSPALGWLVLNPATFFGAFAPDQDIAIGLPAGTSYVKMKASAMPPAFVDGSGHAHMFVAFVWKNTTSNVTNIQSFLHTTVTTGTDTATSSMSSNPPGVTVNTFANSTSSTLDVGVVVAADPAFAVAAASVAWLHAGGTYTQTDVMFTDPTDMTKIFPQVVSTGSTSTNTLLNTLPASNRNGFAFGSTYWDFSAADNKNDLQALAFTTTPVIDTFLRVCTPYAALMIQWDADVYENLPNPTDTNTNSRTTTFYARGIGQSPSGVLAGTKVRTWSVGGFTSTPSGSNSLDLTDPFTSATATTASVITAALETTPAFVHPDPAETTSFTASMVDEFTFNITNWNGTPAILSSQIQQGMTIGIQDPFGTSTTYVRYTIAGLTYDSTNRTITQISVSQPAPFHVNAAVYNVTVSAGPSTAVRQIITTNTDGGSNNRTGSCVFPMVVQIDYASLQSNADHSEIGEMVIPLGDGLTGTVPAGAQVQIRGYNLNGTTIPNSITNGVMVGLSLDSGTTWVTKPILVNSTSIHGQTLATSFGVQSFHGASDLSVPWVTVPAGIDVGDWLVIGAGPNAGRYLITEVTNDSNVSGPRIMLDRPFPVPGSSTIETWYVVTAGADYENDGTIPNLGFSSLGMNFVLTGLPVDTSNNLHARVEFKDGVSGHDVTYEIDSVSVQWTP